MAAKFQFVFVGFCFLGVIHMIYGGEVIVYDDNCNKKILTSGLFTEMTTTRMTGGTALNQVSHSPLNCAHRCKLFPSCDYVSFNMASNTCEMIAADGVQPTQEVKDPDWVTLERKNVRLQNPKIFIKDNIFVSCEERYLSQTSLIHRIPKLLKSWRISFDIKMAGAPVSEYRSVLRVTNGLGINADENTDENLGARIPFFVLKTGTADLMAASGILGQPSFGANVATLSLTTYTRVIMQQTKVDETNYELKCFIDGAQVFNETNAGALEYDDVKLYAGRDPFYNPAPVQLKNIRHVNGLH